MSSSDNKPEDILSQEEIDTLLEDTDDAAASSSGEVSPLNLFEIEAPGREHQIDRWTRRLTKELGPSLAAQFGVEVSVESCTATRVSLQEYLQSLPVPTLVMGVSMPPLNGEILLTTDMAVVASSLDAFFGGVGDPARSENRPVSRTEKRLAGRIARSTLEALRSALAPVKLDRLDLTFTETDASMLDFPKQSMLVLKIELKIGEGGGEIHWVVTQSALDALDQDTADSDESDQQSADWSTEFAESMSFAPVKLTARLADFELTLGEVLALKPGDIIPTDIENSVLVSAGRTPLYRGELGTSDQNHVVRITCCIRSLDDLVEEKQNG